MLPGDLATVIGGIDSSPERIAAIREELGLNRPLWQQYFDWIGGVLHRRPRPLGAHQLDGHQPARREADDHRTAGPRLIDRVADRSPIPLGVYAAMRHRKPTASGSRPRPARHRHPAVPRRHRPHRRCSPASSACPSQGFPREGWSDDFGRAGRSLVLPMLTLAAAQGAVLLRFVRAATLDVLDQDYIRTARAKGLSRTQALVVHGLRNAAIPVVSVLGVQIASLIAGVVVIEQVFNLPGVGRMLLDDIGNRDFDKVQGTILLIAVIVLVIGFLVDLAHHLIDPRLRTTLMRCSSSHAAHRGRGGSAPCLVALLVVAAVVVSYIWVPYDPLRVDPSERLAADLARPPLRHRRRRQGPLLAGARRRPRVSLFVAARVGGIAGVVGAVLGVVSAITPRSSASRSPTSSTCSSPSRRSSSPSCSSGCSEVHSSPCRSPSASASGVVLARILRAEIARGAHPGLRRSPPTPPARRRGARSGVHLLPNIAPIVIVQLSLVAALGDPRRGGAVLPRADVAVAAVVGAHPRRAADAPSPSTRADPLPRPDARARDARLQPPRRRPARRHRPAIAFLGHADAIAFPGHAGRGWPLRSLALGRSHRGTRRERAARRHRTSPSASATQGGRRRLVHHRRAASGWRSSASPVRARRSRRCR